MAPAQTLHQARQHPRKMPSSWSTMVYPLMQILPPSPGSLAFVAEHLALLHARGTTEQSANTDALASQ